MNYDEALEAANGNTDAAMFLMDYVAYCHLLDDVVDKDVPVTDERLVKESLNLIGQFCVNPWVMVNKGMLFPLIVSGFNAWPDSNRMGVSVAEQERIAADVVKGIYHEMVYVVAYMTGGHEHMRKVSQHREYDFEKGAR